jgi:hypothetical protein
MVNCKIVLPLRLGLPSGLFSPEFRLILSLHLSHVFITIHGDSLECNLTFDWSNHANSREVSISLIWWFLQTAVLCCARENCNSANWPFKQNVFLLNILIFEGDSNNMKCNFSRDVLRMPCFCSDVSVTRAPVASMFGRPRVHGRDEMCPCCFGKSGHRRRGRITLKHFVRTWGGLMWVVNCSWGWMKLKCKFS